MRDIEWSSDALADFDKAIEYINLRNPIAADRLAERILEAIDRLGDLPTGHPSRVGGLYEKLVQKTSYIVAYSVSGDTVYVARIIHGNRDWPAGGWPTDD
jgi:toxin ParE1/3/4